MIGTAIATLFLLGQSAPPTLSPPRPPTGPDRSRRAEPLGNQAYWVSPEDYPARALREEREGVLTALLGVGTNGRVFTCGIRRSSGSVDLDLAACQNLVRRGRYTPATDANGVEVIDLRPIAIRWTIPLDIVPTQRTAPANATRATQKPWLDSNGRGPAGNDPLQPLPVPRAEIYGLGRPEEFRLPPSRARTSLSPRTWLLRFDIDGEGRVSGCTVATASPDPAFDALLCPRAQAQVQFMPAQAADGAGVPSWVYVGWTMTVPNVQ